MKPAKPHDDRTRLARLARGYSQEDLAEVAGVTRQAISGIESGRWSPSLSVALALARALDASVEELFGEEEEAPQVTARLASSPLAAPPAAAPPPTEAGGASPARVRLAEVGGDVIAFPMAGDGTFLPGFAPARGVVAGTPSGEGSAVVSRIAAEVPALAVAGCDPALALLQGPLRNRQPPMGLVWWPCGNAAALELLAKGAVHAAAVHRGLTAPTTLPGIAAAVGFASWREGLAVAPRHEGDVGELGDAVRLGLRFVNREHGSEARRLLDQHLAALGIPAQDVTGYDAVCGAHLLAASAIASDLADVGVTTEPAARAFGLGFVSWQQEITELLVPRSLMGAAEVRGLLEVLGGRELHRQLEAIEGYDAEVCGQVSSP